LKDNFTFHTVKECQTAETSGECVKAWIEAETNEPYVGPTAGIQFTDGYLDSFFNNSGKCAAILGISNVEAKSDEDAFQWYLDQDPWWYFFGGKVAQVAPDATAIGPQHRTGTLYSYFLDPKDCDNAVKQEQNLSKSMRIHGAAFNHWWVDGLTNETKDFEEFAWGSNVPRLKKIKAEYDPTHMFNARSTFGYRPVCETSVCCPDGCVPKKASMRALLFAALPCPEGCVPA